MDAEFEGDGEIAPSSPSSAYYGLHIPASGMSRTDHDLICRFMHQVLRGAGSDQSRRHWRFVVDQSLTLFLMEQFEMSRGSRGILTISHSGLRLRMSYDYLWHALNALKLDVPPPKRAEWDDDKWTAAMILAENQKQSRQTWSDWWRRCFGLSSFSKTASRPEIPPDYAAHCHQQMAGLKLWIVDRGADGSLLRAIRTQRTTE